MKIKFLLTDDNGKKFAGEVNLSPQKTGGSTQEPSSDKKNLRKISTKG